MIYERSIFIFAGAISSILVTCSGGETTQATIIKPRSITYQAIIQSGTAKISPSSDDLIIEQGADDYLPSTNQISDTTDVPAESEIISKRWTALGMIVTSTLFVFVLWILFKPEPQDQAEKTLSNLSTLDEQNSFDTLTNGLEMIEQEELVSPQLFPSIKEHLSKDLLDDTVAADRPLKLTKKRRIHPNPTISEDNQDSTTDYEPIQVDSETKGLVKIVTSSTTEIDVVFELIQDLQQSDRKLRRKAIWELAQTADSRSIEPLVHIMPEVNSLDKSLILSAITQIAYRNFESIHDVLFASLADEDSEVRKDAIRDLIALHEPTSKINQRLFEMLGDSDREVRQTAEWALKRINLGSLKTESYTTSDNGVASAKGTSK